MRPKNHSISNAWGLIVFWRQITHPFTKYKTRKAFLLWSGSPAYFVGRQVKKLKNWTWFEDSMLLSGFLCRKNITKSKNKVPGIFACQPSKYHVVVHEKKFRMKLFTVTEQFGTKSAWAVQLIAGSKVLGHYKKQLLSLSSKVSHVLLDFNLTEINIGYVFGDIKRSIYCTILFIVI